MKKVIEIASFGFVFFRIAKLVNQSSDMRMDVYVHAKDYEMFKVDFDGDEDWLHPVAADVRKIANLRQGRFWSERGVSADLYLLSEDATLFAYPEKGAKVIFLPIGFDLTTQPFPMLAAKNGSNVFRKLKLVLIALLQKSRIRHADAVWASPYPVLLRSILAIRKGELPFDRFLPYPINYKAHRQPSSISGSEAEKILGETRDKFLVFFPGRLMVTKSPDDLRTGQTKGAEEAVRGFLEFVRQSDADALLLLIDHSISPDRQRVFDLVTELDGHAFVKWIRSPTSEIRLDNYEMAAIYQASDVVLGDFGSGWFGQTALEAGAHGKPFITWIEPDFMKENFQSNPFVVAKAEHDIAEALFGLYQSEQMRISRGAEMEVWFEKFFSANAAKAWYHGEILKALD